MMRRNLFKLYDLRSMDRKELELELIKLRRAVRYCRDQKGDDRCWLDYYAMYAVVPGIPKLTQLPDRVTFMQNCAVFVLFQRCANLNISLEEARPQHDYDIFQMTNSELLWDIVSWRKLIWRDYFKHIRGVKKAEDMLLLFNKLPDKVIYDMRLPDGMLGSCDLFYECKKKEARLGLLRLGEW